MVFPKIKIFKIALTVIFIVIAVILETTVSPFLLQAQTFGYVFGNTDYGQPTVPQPAQWESYVDPVTNITVRRITDVAKDVPGATDIHLEYVRKSHVSSDGRYLLMYVVGATGGNPYYIMDLQTHTVRVAPHVDPKQVYGSINGGAEPEYRWDHSGNCPTCIYYRHGLKFYQGNISYPSGQPSDPASNILLHNFANEYSTAKVAYNGEEGDSSGDSRYWIFMIYNGYPDYITTAIVTYDKETDTILGTLSNPPTPDFVDVAPSGSKVVIGNYWQSGGAGSVYDGPHVWDLTLTNPMRIASGPAHSGWAWDKNGTESYVQIDMTADLVDQLKITDISDGSYIAGVHDYYDLGGGLGYTDHHFGRVYNSYQRGWVFMSVYNSKVPLWSTNQILAIEALPRDQNPRIWRIAYMHNNYTGYSQNPFASLSQDGKKIYFASNWNGTDNMEIYEVSLPDNWWVDLNSGFPTPTYQCSDSIDNDGDGLIDYPQDAGCTSTTDNSEYTSIDTTPPAAPTGLVVQ